MFPLVAEEHQLLEDVSKKVSTIFLSDEFARLKKELEDIYRKEGCVDAFQLALQDAIYAILSERG